MAKIPLFVLATAPFALVGQSTDAPAYTWSATGPLQVARQGACAAALQDGRILIAGGQDANGSLHSVEIYQQDGTFAPAKDMLRARAGHTCTSLLDGRVLIAGGLGDGPAVQAETYDPATDTWTPAENGTERWNHTATLLPDGRVLLAGGETADGSTSLLEWLNPATNRIRTLPASLSAARTLHASAILPDGSVLISGGWNELSILDSAEIVTLTGGVQAAATLPAPRAGHTATTLDNGCVLIAGGIGLDGDTQSASVYCADSGTYHPAGDMSVSRYGQLAIRLPNNGKVLVTGGFSQGEASATSELYDPDANAFLPAGSLTLARLGIAAAADPISGAVLAVGGYTADGPVAVCGILKAPSVVFDKVHYLDGDAVTVTGLGWAPSEKVNLDLLVQTFTLTGLAQIPLDQHFQTTASALGRIQLTLFTATPQNAGATYHVFATGATSGLTASNSASQLSRTNMTLSVLPFPALTRQPVTIQAIVQGVSSVGPLDGTVNFLLGTTPLGSVSSTNQVTSVSTTGHITDGTSNTISVGESLGRNASGFSTNIQLADGSVRFINPGGAFQLVTRDIPAGSIVLSANSPGSVTASYAPLTSLYAPNSVSTTVSVQKRGVNVSFLQLFGAQPKVGDPIQVVPVIAATQFPIADVTPTGSVHIGVAPGTAPLMDAPLSPNSSLFGASGSSQGSISVTLPAGVHTFSAQYDGDSVYLPGGIANAGTVTVAKGTVGFSLIPSKTTFTVGEPITLTGRILHPKVVGATPTGQISLVMGPTQFKGATVGPDPQNTGLIDTNLPVVGTPSPGNFAVTMTYGGDANFLPISAGTIFTIAKATPQVVVIPPTQVFAGQPATFTVRIAAPAGLTPPAASGQVTVTGVSNGASASVVPSTGSSVAIIHQTFPTAGTFVINFQYGGDTNYLATTSAQVKVLVQ